jgi:hypothetical protein
MAIDREIVPVRRPLFMWFKGYSSNLELIAQNMRKFDAQSQYLLLISRAGSTGPNPSFRARWRCRKGVCSFLGALLDFR